MKNYQDTRFAQYSTDALLDELYLDPVHNLAVLQELKRREEKQLTR